MARRLDAALAASSFAQLISGEMKTMRHLLAATALAAITSAAASAAAPQLTPAQRQATHAMFEQIINTPTVIGRHKVPQMAQYVADQFKAGGFPAADSTIALR